jgi:PhzF family phenazine biosynthesis protein
VLRFSQVDVFTDEFLLGNPVAVVHDADGLREEQMAALARWTNLSETTFLLTPSVPEADYRLRIFTPRAELPFAGHPTLGSARAWLEAGGRPKRPDGVVQECGAGMVRVRAEGGRLAFAAPPLLRSGPLDRADLDLVGRGLRLARSEVVDAAWVDNGPGWMGVLLPSADAVLGLAPDFEAMESANLGVVGPYPPGSSPPTRSAHSLPWSAERTPSPAASMPASPSG